MNILGTGLSGLVGSRVTSLLSSHHEFADMSKETGFDITDYSSLAERFRTVTSPWVFHFAAYTDVQGAEAQRNEAELGMAWMVNVKATEHIAELCRKYGKHLLYLSTDYVFDGEKDIPYAETDVPNPKGWYAMTKWEGEKRVLSLGDKATVVRISNPYRSFPVGKKDWVHKILDRLEAKQPVASPSDAKFSPTFIDDLSSLLDVIVTKGASGVYHGVSRVGISPYAAATLIASGFGYDPGAIAETSHAAFYEGRASVPKNGVLSHEKTDELGVGLHSFEEGIMEMRRQEDKI